MGVALLGAGAAAAQDDMRIALVVKSLGNGFFEAANRGAQEAAEELGNVEIIYIGPTDTTAEGQIQVINSLIAQRVDAIAVSANDPDALVPALEKAMQRGITVISWDSGVAPEGRQMHLAPSSDELIGQTLVDLANDHLPEDGGQYGLALRWISAALNETEFGFYFVNYHSRLPYISGRAGTLQGVLGGDYPGSATYFTEYPEDIRLYGISFNTVLGQTGIALQGEASYRPDMPLQVDDVELLFSALSAPAALLPQMPTNPALQQAAFLGSISQLGQTTFGQEVPGFREIDTWQAQLTATKLFGPTLGASQWVLLVEVGATGADLPSQDVLRFDGFATYTSGNPVATAARAQPATADPSGFADDFSWGYRVATRWDFDNLFFGINVSPTLAFSHDVSGNTPLPIANFVEGRTSLTIGTNFVYQNQWTLELRYAAYGGADEHNLIHDRDFVSTTVKYAF
jgi:hypothetical protein